jgi:hypothetical protein
MRAILKFVGKEYWPWPGDHIKETRERGPSIRIAELSVPDMEVPYPVLFVHPRGTFIVTHFGLTDLYNECLNKGHTDKPEDEMIQGGVPTLAFIEVFADLDRKDKVEFDRLVDKYGIEFLPAVTHYSYITGLQVVMGDDGEGVDTLDSLRRLGHNPEPVKVVRVEAEDAETL